MKKKSKPGRFTELMEKDRQKAFIKAYPDDYIMEQVYALANYLPNFGYASAKELLLMLSVWMVDPENETQSKKYWSKLK